VVFVTASTHLAVNTEVAWPCTVNPALSAGAAVACASSESSPASPRITYANNPQTGDIMMTVEF
jgi:hypothetical protein